MIDYLAKAIKAKFDAAQGAGTVYAAVGGRLYLHEAPQDEATMPYIVFSFVDDVPEYTFDRAFENARIQFGVYSDSRSVAELGDIVRKLAALFDWTTLTVTSHTSIYMRRLMRTVWFEDRVWRALVDYRVYLEVN